MTRDSSQPKHFFISYNKADRAWAEWIGWQLEEAGYATALQAWDFRPGSNFVLEMDRAARLAERTIAVLSPDYIKAVYTQPEWAAAFRLDPTGEGGTLVPVQVRECRHELKGLLRQIISIDLVGLDEPTAREMLLEGIRHERNKPTTAPLFPGSIQRSVPAQPDFPAVLPDIWNLPYPRNPYFTGREDTLKRLHDALTSNKTAALTQLQAISGLGGIGKTQTAVEYAYRYQSDYKAVLWAKADTREILVPDFVTLAGLLNLPEKDAQDQSLAVAAVKRWLQTNRGWLLILDNADDLAMAREFIPPTVKGHILLTTRAEATGRLAQRIDIEKMEPEEGALFLLRRAGVIAQDDPIDKASAPDRAKAKEISQVLDGLPLALDQAGAYIEEVAYSLSDYLNLYRTRRTQLLKRRGGLVADHPEPVATTWSLSFEKVEKANPAAADLLRLCAFLHPDAIPEEIITEGADDLGPTLQPVASDSFELNAAIEELRKFSLLRRDPDAKTLTIHRLVQEVLKDGMDQDVQRQWAERTVRAVNNTFPSPEYETWERCRRCLPHAQACVLLIDQWGMEFTDVVRLLNEVGLYLSDRAQYVEAESLYQRAITIGEKTLGPDHLDLATMLNNLATLYSDQGKDAEAEPLYQRAIAIGEKTLGPEDPLVAIYTNNLASLYSDQGKYGQAEPLYQRAITIGEKTLGPDHPDLATRLSNLANLYSDQGKYTEAEPLYQRAIAIGEKTLGLEHPLVATYLNNLAELYRDQGKDAEAEPLYQRAIAIGEKTLGPGHPELALYLENYADLLRKTNREAEAAQMEARAKAIRTRHAQENPTS
jgi:tetratricopeptide (TPR) repeat protein